ncbi:MFS transporter [Pectinatus frisingensis]|uniref:MFS transporter n=1 Tax=Pectinatus frisingensis TaxID=865 RepID=UPI0018C4B554|nr:MFS transporter [Pectinatus frisingensis]
MINSKPVSSYITSILAIACGVIVANLYYAQPLIATIGSAVNLPLTLSGLTVTFTQIGYVFGLIFLVPLLDLVENRRLVLITLIIAVLALIASIISKNAAVFLSASIFIGLGTTATQILVPYSAYLSDEQHRGATVGKVMSGLLLGIMLARPVSGIIAGTWGWQAVFLFSAVLTSILWLLLLKVLPKRQPVSGAAYGELIYSLWQIVSTTAILRRRAFYQACLFGAFSLFWTAVPLWLADNFGLSQHGVAIFSFVGVAGAVAAPIAGRLADRKMTKPLTGAAMITATLSFLLTLMFMDFSILSLFVLIICAITLDMSVSGNLVLSQRIIYSLGDKVRGRVNGIFMAIFFIGGAVGSLLGSWSYSYGSWFMTASIGAMISFIAFLYYLTEKS